MMLYLNACEVTVTYSNQKIFLHFFTWTCALQFEKGSATHALDSKYAPFPIPVIS